MNYFRVVNKITSAGLIDILLHIYTQFCMIVGNKSFSFFMRALLWGFLKLTHGCQGDGGGGGIGLNKPRSCFQFFLFPKNGSNANI